MSYDHTTQFLREHASRALGQAISTREAILLSKAYPPQFGPRGFNYSISKPNRDPAPKLSELLAAMEGDGNNPDVPSVLPSEGKWLDDQSTAWMKTYFPMVSTRLSGVPEAWIAGVLGGSQQYGAPSFVFDEVWARARSRAETVRRAEYRGIEGGFSARGFSMPTGAMIVALGEADQRGSDMINEVNVEQAIKNVEVRSDMVQLAATLAVQFHANVMTAMANFHRDWTALLQREDRDRDLQRLKVRSEVMATFYNAISKYYDVDVAFERLRLQAEQTRTQTGFQNDQRTLEVYGLRDRDADALGQAVRGFADISSAAANAASSLTAQIESI